MDVGTALTPAEASALARLGAAAAAGDDDRLRSVFAEARGHVSPGDIEEILLQTYLFAGFPRAINAFFAWQGWAAREGLTRETRDGEAPDPEGWRNRGEELCRVVYGAGYEALQERLARLHPALAEWTLVEGYGKVLSRVGPDAGRRELAAIGSLVELGAERQLRAHLRGAMHAGVATATVGEAARAAANDAARAEMVERLLAALEG